MAWAFLDSSALVRRYYTAEHGANRVRVLCAPSNGNTIVLARLAPVEVAATLNRRVRDGSLTAEGCVQRWRTFQIHWSDQYQVIETTEAVYSRAERLVFGAALRSLDALHLASALVAAERTRRRTLQFWTADKQQAEAARREGLQVELL
jgi:predicted nucleic acid-binding protein